MTKEPKSPVIGFRLDSEGRAALDQAADAHGMKPASYARWLVLDAIGTATSTPSVQRRIMHADELRRLLGELGRQGSNLNQIAKHLNSGGRATELREAIMQLTAEHGACLRALTSLLVGTAQ